MVPSTARVPRSITPLFASVVAIKLPQTVTVALSVIPAAAPLVSVRLPPTLVTSEAADVPSATTVVPLSSVA